MELFVKCAAFAIISVLFAVIIKRHLPEISIVLAIITCALIIGAINGVLGGVIDFMNELSTAAGIAPEVLAPLLKVCAIAILSKLCSDICKEAGAMSVATTVELCGSVVSLMLSIPLIKSVMQLITGM